MDDDANRHDVDARLRDILMPPAAAVDRVVSGALRGQQSGMPAPRWRWAAVAAAGLLIVAAATWQRAGRREPTIPVTTVSRDASILVVKSSDGRRWLFTPTAAPRSGGHYVIVVPASEVAP